MFPWSETEGRKEMFHDMKEIAELNINEECIIQLKSKIGNLRNSEIVSDRDAIGNVLKDGRKWKAINEVENENTP